jgi:hypothetical protein
MGSHPLAPLRRAPACGSYTAWWALLAPKLELCGFAPDKRIEGLNFGVTGYGTAQEYAVLQSHALRYVMTRSMAGYACCAAAGTPRWWRRFTPQPAGLHTASATRNTPKPS